MIASLFDLRDSTKTFFKAESLRLLALNGVSAIEISVEPKDGSLKPTGEIVLSGKVPKE